MVKRKKMGQFTAENYVPSAVQIEGISSPFEILNLKTVVWQQTGILLKNSPQNIQSTKKRFSLKKILGWPKSNNIIQNHFKNANRVISIARPPSDHRLHVRHHMMIVFGHMHSRMTYSKVAALRSATGYEKYSFVSWQTRVELRSLVVRETQHYIGLKTLLRAVTD